MACLTLSVLTPFNAVTIACKLSSEYDLLFSDETTGISSQFGSSRMISSMIPWNDKFKVSCCVGGKHLRSDLPHSHWSSVWHRAHRHPTLIASPFERWIWAFCQSANPTKRNSHEFPSIPGTISQLDLSIGSHFAWTSSDDRRHSVQLLRYADIRSWKIARS